MRRAFRWGGLLALAGCLQPGGPVVSALDRVSPVVLAASPDAGATVPINTLVQVTFSELLDPATLDGGITLLNGASPVPIQIVTSSPPYPWPSYVNDGGQEGNGWSVTILQASGGSPCPDGGGGLCLHSASSYVLRLGGTLADPEGNTLDGGFQLPFRTQ